MEVKIRLAIARQRPKIKRYPIIKKQPFKRLLIIQTLTQPRRLNGPPQRNRLSNPESLIISTRLPNRAHVTLIIETPPPKKRVTVRVALLKIRRPVDRPSKTLRKNEGIVNLRNGSGLRKQSALGSTVVRKKGTTAL